MATNWNEILSNTSNLNDVLSILKKVLAGLEVKADITTIDEAISNIDQLKEDINDKVDLLSENLDQKLGLDQLNEIGVGNRAYKTYVAMDADKANIPAKSKVTVTNDTTESNNGDWQWDGAVFTKSVYDPLSQAKIDATTKASLAEVNAKTYTNEKTKNISDIDIGEALFAKVDTNGNLVEVTGKDGKQYLTGLEKSVQDNINENKISIGNIEDNLNTYDESEISLAFVDKDDRVIAYLKNNAHLVLQGLDDSVQNEIISTKSALSDLTSAIAQTEVAPVKGLVKSNYSVDANTILTMKVQATNSMPYIEMDSPYRKNDAFVHPCVIELSEPMRGYKYLMCITPYWNRNPIEENPTIYGSNDQVTWEMLTGFAQPLDNPPEISEPESGEHGYLSDNWWAYDPINKELYCCYRKGYYANYPNGYSDNDRMQLLYRKTTNCLTWGKPTMFTPETTLGVDGQVAPSLIYDKANNRWALFYLKTSDWRIYVRFNTKLEVSGWSAPQEIGYRAFADANNIKGWHIETKFVGNKLFMLIGDSVNGRYYFAKSNDDTFLNWTFSANSVLENTWTLGAYKGSFLEVPQENGNIKLRLYFTDTGVGRLRTALSPEISIL